MAFLLKGGAIFLHIPKTGGSWVKAVLKESGLIEKQLGHEHATWDRVLFRDKYYDVGLKDILKTKMKNRLYQHLYSGTQRNQINDGNPFVFCFVRNPLSWYESWWKYMIKMQWKDWGKTNSRNHWHPNAILNSLGSEDFNQFIKNVISTRPGYVTELYGSYTQPGINYIGKTENLANDLIEVLTYLGLDFNEEFIRNYKKVNVSTEEKTEMISWDENVKEILLKMEFSALIHYGYGEEKVNKGLSLSLGAKPIHKSLQKIVL